MWLTFKIVVNILVSLIVFVSAYFCFRFIPKELATEEWTYKVDEKKYLRNRKVFIVLLTCFILIFNCINIFSFYKNYIDLPKIEYNKKSELVLKSGFSLIEAKDDSLYIEKLGLLGYSTKIIDANQIITMECNSDNPKKYGTTLKIKYRTNYKVKNDSNDKDYRINDDDSTSVEEIEVRIRNYEQYRLIAKRIGYR